MKRNGNRKKTAGVNLLFKLVLSIFLLGVIICFSNVLQ